MDEDTPVHPQRPEDRGPLLHRPAARRVGRGHHQHQPAAHLPRPSRRAVSAPRAGRRAAERHGGGVPLHARKAQLLACVEIGNDRDGAVSLQHSFALTAGGDVRIAPRRPCPPSTTRRSSAPRSSTAPQRSWPAPPSRPPPCAGARASWPPSPGTWPRVRRVAPRSISGSAGTSSPDSRRRRSRASAGFVTGGSSPTSAATTARATTFAPRSRRAARSGALHWSIILVGIPDYRVIANRIGRYHLNSCSPLSREPDGGLRIDIAPEPVPDRPEANWSPAPRAAPSLSQCASTCPSRRPGWRLVPAPTGPHRLSVGRVRLRGPS